MAIVRTSKGTAKGYSSGGTLASLTIPNVTLSQGSLLTVGVGTDGGPISATWNGFALTQGPANALFYLANATAGTGSLDVSMNDSFAACIVASEFTNVELVSPVDKSATASGSSTTPNSGNTPTTTALLELLVGYVFTGGPVSDAAGTWGGGFAAGQRDGTNNPVNRTTSEGWLEVAAMGVYAASKSGITSRAWTCEITTFKSYIAPAGPIVVVSQIGTTIKTLVLGEGP